jgi:hypothetical protein
MSKKTGNIYFVHAVDTEGPLYENIDEIFKRIKEYYGIDIKASEENLDKLQKKEIDCGKFTDAISEMLRSDQITFKDTWDKIYEMMDSLMSNEFRNQLPDMDGNGYVFSWFCVDHVGYNNNPRRRTMGFHGIHEEYQRILKKYNCEVDRLYWHYHPMSFSKDAHRSGNNFNFTNLHNEILTRRIIDHSWFPAAFRPTSSIRMDGNVWLEQWIPFELGNMNVDDHESLMNNQRLTGVYGLDNDCRGAPTDWSIYNPNIRDYRKQGTLKRYIGRCLNVKSYTLEINEMELTKAFEKAKSGENVLVSVTNHDFRDMVKETTDFVSLVKSVSEKYTDVGFKWSNTVAAFRNVVGIKRQDPVSFSIFISENILHVKSNKQIWGPQPFLAIKTKEGKYYTDNFINDDEYNWRYSFDSWTIELDSIQSIGVATNDLSGNTVVYVNNLIDLKNNWKQSVYNNNDY